MSTRDFTINMSEVGDAAFIGESVRGVLWMFEQGLQPRRMGDRAVAYVDEKKLADLLVIITKERLTYLLKQADVY